MFHMQTACIQFTVLILNDHACWQLLTGQWMSSVQDRQLAVVMVVEVAVKLHDFGTYPCIQQ